MRRYIIVGAIVYLAYFPKAHNDDLIEHSDPMFPFVIDMSAKSQFHALASRGPGIARTQNSTRLSGLTKSRT